MADSHRTPNGDTFAAIPFEAEGGGAAHGEVVAEIVQLTAITPVLKATTTLTRRETRDLALAMLEASQHITEEED
jgi:hypothetical protein